MGQQKETIVAVNLYLNLSSFEILLQNRLKSRNRGLEARQNKTNSSGTWDLLTINRMFPKN